jgi:RNase P/RNase MRP subunit p29
VRAIQRRKRKLDNGRPSRARPTLVDRSMWEWVRVRIEEIRNGMRNIHIEGKIVDMNQFMLVLDDETGRTFVRYNYRNLAKPVQKGDYVKIDNGQAVNYSGILQLKLPRNGSITPTQ